VLAPANSSIALSDNTQVDVLAFEMDGSTNAVRTIQTRLLYVYLRVEDEALQALLNVLVAARDNPGLAGVERSQLFYCSLKQIDQPMAIKARLVHARERASGDATILKLNRVPMTASKKAKAERPISTLVIYCITHLLSFGWMLVNTIFSASKAATTEGSISSPHGDFNIT
jgi:hypothetical protein